MASTSGSGVGTSECEGEDQDDSSSSCSHTVLEAGDALENLTLDSTESKPNADMEDELSAFRAQWQRELEDSSSPQRETSPAAAPVVVQEEPLTDEERAKQLFLTAADLERSGQLYEAIQHYKRAMQLQPDVERRLYESNELREDTPEEVIELEEPHIPPEAPGSDDEELVPGEDLVARMQRLVARRGCLIEPARPTKGGHISWLPYEVLLVLVRWVVGAELDVGSLERLAAVCRGLYLAARDQEIWCSLCMRTWGMECGTPRNHGFSNWRQMYINRPRLLMNGCYIGRTTYIRHGETSFQDQSYRPWYLIVYYRYLRFFPGGYVIVWTTADEPAVSVGQLTRGAKPPGLATGHYRLIGDKVVVVVKKGGEKKAGGGRFKARRQTAGDNPDQTFHMEFELRDVRSRRNCSLRWARYSVSRREQMTHFDLSHTKFPPLAFSRVRGYTAESHAALPEHNTRY